MLSITRLWTGTPACGGFPIHNECVNAVGAGMNSNSVVRRTSPALRSMIALLIAALLLLCLGGCFSEHSYPMQPQELRPIAAAEVHHHGLPMTMRQWTGTVHH